MWKYMYTCIYGSSTSTEAWLAFYQLIFFVYRENKTWDFMWWSADSHEMSSLTLSEKKKNKILEGHDGPASLTWV